MGKPAEQYIPSRILEAAKAAQATGGGCSESPLWYVGRQDDPGHALKSGLGKVVVDAYAAKGLEPEFVEPLRDEPK